MSMGVLEIVAILLLTAICANGEDDSKWVWRRKESDQKSNGRLFESNSDEYLENEKGPARYEIYERPEDGFGPFAPHRPQGPNFINRPISGGFVPHERPDQGLYGHGDGPYGHGGGSGILTGPVPSWQREPPFKQFDTCKCTERFNCKSPGISYGHCDVGKQYCCYNKRGGVSGSLPPSRPIHSPENGVLVGPGGPFDGPGHYRPRPGHYRPGFGNTQDPGVLVGPGGPTGIIGRPPAHHQRPGYPQQGPGVLVGPGGPYDVGPGGHRPYPRPGFGGSGGFGYGRSKKD